MRCAKISDFRNYRVFGKDFCGKFEKFNITIIIAAMIIITLTMAGGSGLIGTDFSRKFEQFDIASETSPNFEEVGENI